MVTKPSLGMRISIYTGRVTLVKNLIWGAIETLDRHQKTHSGRKLFNAVIVKRLSLKKNLEYILGFTLGRNLFIAAVVTLNCIKIMITHTTLYNTKNKQNVICQ